MASAQVVETSVTNNSPSQDSKHPDHLFQFRRLVCFPCYEIQSFHDTNRGNKRYDRMCLLSVYSSTSKQTASNQRIKSCLFIDNKYFCLAFFSNFLENQNCLHFFLKSIDLVRNIDHIISYFVSNLVLATTIQRPTS